MPPEVCKHHEALMHFVFLSCLTSLSGNLVLEPRIRPRLFRAVDSASMWGSGSGIAVPVGSNSFAFFDGCRFAPSQECIIYFVEWSINSFHIGVVSKNLRNFCLFANAEVGGSGRQRWRILELLVVVIINQWLFESWIFRNRVKSSWVS